MSKYVEAAEQAHKALAELVSISPVGQKPEQLAAAVDRIADMASALRWTADNLRRSSGNSKTLRNPHINQETEEFLEAVQTRLTTCIERGRSAARAWSGVRDHLYDFAAACPPHFRL
ncbi:hypothetical protein N8J89_12850 [Crossiella sp. CA-258035]|uniref:hypothetical protein n=1 Tax=Crossiella sp. CA-258035 TaxID=2981138 RepID=UPI0024BCD14D|nr:hypothetical protein [Crossiella sp. CA-258035]WHT21909.1 hypothetical protein N8J89_12850 [Crossiella sp. CA-258035]